MLLLKLVRGNVIEFIAEPTDETGAAVSPDRVHLQLSYIGGDGVRTFDEIDMQEQSAGSYRATWDSSIASSGRVHWSVRSTDPSTAEDGQFQLNANLANNEVST